MFVPVSVFVSAQTSPGFISRTRGAISSVADTGRTRYTQALLALHTVPPPRPPLEQHCRVLACSLTWQLHSVAFSQVSPGFLSLKMGSLKNQCLLSGHLESHSRNPEECLLLCHTELLQRYQIDESVMSAAITSSCLATRV